MVSQRKGFTLKWYGPDLLDYPSLTTAMENSLIVAFAFFSVLTDSETDTRGLRSAPFPALDSPVMGDRRVGS